MFVLWQLSASVSHMHSQASVKEYSLLCNHLCAISVSFFLHFLPPLLSGLQEIMVVVTELQKLGFNHQVYTTILFILHNRPDKRDEATEDSLALLQYMHHHVRIV